MKKAFYLFWQLLIFPVLYIPYHLLNTYVIVKWLGCGCPKILENGEQMANSFNANDFTRAFWFSVAFIVTLLSFFSIKNISRLHMKITYVISIAVLSVSIASLFISTMMWK